MPLSFADAPSHESPAPQTIRRCGRCNACCTGTLRLEIEGQQVERDKPCRHCTREGCDIYVARPAGCRSFTCGWLSAQSHLPEFMRPDQCGVILLLNRLHWRSVPVDLAVAVERRIPAQTLAWLIAYARQHRRPLIYQVDEEWEGVGPHEFGQALRRAVAQGRRLW